MLVIVLNLILNKTLYYHLYKRITNTSEKKTKFKIVIVFTLLYYTVFINDKSC